MRSRKGKEKVGSERDESALQFKKDRDKKAQVEGTVEAEVITESFHVGSDVPQTPIKGFVDRMH